jgi:hypothetical protein
VVVCHYSQVVSGKAVRLQDNEILLKLVTPFHIAAYQVVNSRSAGLGHSEANDSIVVADGLADGPGLTEVSTPAPFARVRAGLPVRPSKSFQFLAAAVALVGVALVQELFRQSLVDLQPVRLLVGSVGALYFGALVPVNVKPAQAIQDGVDGPAYESCLVGVLNPYDELPVYESCLVGVLNPYDELPAVVASEQPIEESGAYVSDVGLPCRARSESDANLSGQACNSVAMKLRPLYHAIGYSLNGKCSPK